MSAGLVGRRRFEWRLRTRSLRLGERTLLMGIVNLTPDSFSDGGRFLDVRAAVDHGLRLLDEGADLLDLGGESTRPGATAISAEEEQARVLPVLRGLRAARPDVVSSVDTYHAATAERAVEMGAEVVNDVSGLLWDESMAEVLARAQVGVVLMHTRGRPQEWAGLPAVGREEIVPLVAAGLGQSLGMAGAAGIEEEKIVLDPGFGFGKRGDENLVLLARLGELQAMGFPLLAGVSRKRFLTAGVTEVSEQARLQATLAAQMVAVLGGAQVLRVHDVAAARSAVGVVDRMLLA